MGERVVKDAMERRKEIMDVAERLFIKKGYDKTSTNDILDEISIARGTLYYHFKSKEEILDSIIDRMINDVVEKASLIAEDKSIPVFERITRVVMTFNVKNDLGNEVVEQIHKPQNALMHQKTQNKVLGGITPLVTALIEEGVERGICKCKYPRQTMEMIILYADEAFDTANVVDMQEMMLRIEAYIYNLELLLSMQEGALREYIMPIFQQ